MSFLWGCLDERTGADLFGVGLVCSTFASSIFSAGSVQVQARFGISSEVAVLGTSLFVLGYVRAYSEFVRGPFFSCADYLYM